MTLQQLIDQYHAREATIPQTVVTPKGQAVQTAIRLQRLLAQLEPADRVAVLEVLAEEVAVPTVAHCQPVHR